MPPDGTGPDARNTVILRRTLSAISWIYAFWSGLLAAMALSLGQGSRTGLYDARFILLHAGLLGAAGAWQWRPRRGALALTILAAAGSAFFVVLDLLRGPVETAFIDGAYVPLAAFLWIKSRASA